MNNREENVEKRGFVDRKIDKGINIVEEIKRIKKEKNAVILAHYYQTPDVQDIADFVGDSLALSQEAARTKADIILFAGVHFMAETAKILSPGKKVLIPDLNAGCSLAESCDPDDFREFVNAHPDRTVISYVNTSAAIKALTDIVCTSTNALQIVESLPKGEKVIFAPDRNLGNYIKNQTDRDIIVWDGACHVHEEFSLEAIVKIKEENRGSKVIVHPECELPVRLFADFIGSTSALLSYTQKSDADVFIVATEPGIIHQMIKKSPGKTFIPAPGKDSTCGCSECNFMKLITMEKIYNSLLYELPEVNIEETLRLRAELPIRKMLEISEKLGL